MRKMILFLVVICFIAGCLDSSKETKEEPQNQLPVARIVVNVDQQPIYQGDTVEFDGSRSYDNDGGIQYYDWDIGGNSFTGEKTSLVVVGTGIWQISLTVEDNNHTTSTETTTIEVLPAIEIDIKSFEHRDGFFVDYYLYVELEITNHGGETFDIESSASSEYFYFFVYDGDEEYEGYPHFSEEDVIPPYSQDIYGLDFDYFPDEATPDYVLFKYNDDFQDEDEF